MDAWREAPCRAGLGLGRLRGLLRTGHGGVLLASSSCSSGCWATALLCKVLVMRYILSFSDLCMSDGCDAAVSGTLNYSLQAQGCH